MTKLWPNHLIIVDVNIYYFENVFEEKQHLNLKRFYLVSWQDFNVVSEQDFIVVFLSFRNVDGFNTRDAFGFGSQPCLGPNDEARPDLHVKFSRAQWFTRET